MQSVTTSMHHQIVISKSNQLLIKVIVENVVTFFGTQCSSALLQHSIITIWLDHQNRTKPNTNKMYCMQLHNGPRQHHITNNNATGTRATMGMA